MSEWNTYKLGEICDIRDGTHDSPKEVQEGKKLITSKHIKFGKIDFSSAYEISIEDYKNVNKRSKVDKYDILFSMIGTIAETVIVDFEPDFAIKNVGLFKTKNNHQLAKWIYYYLKSNDAKAEIEACLKGTTQQYITLGDLRNFPIQLPTFLEIDAITEVLSSLDDKIDLLQRQNKTLEEIAETLFRQWFVEDTSASETTIGEITKITSGKSLHRSQFLEKGTYPIYGSNGIIGWTDNYTFDENLIITGRVGTLGTVKIIDEKCWISDNVLIIKPNSELYKYPIYFSMKDYDFESLNVGSTQPLLTQGELNKQLVVILDEYKLLSFKQYFDELFNKIKLNLTQIQQLETLRDTLLPKLMSGDVRVN